MFENWGFLISEMVLLLILAALLGLLVGWIIWGRRGAANDSAGASSEADRLRSELNACRETTADQAAKIANLEDDLVSAKGAAEVTPPPTAPVSAATSAVVTENVGGALGASEADADAAAADKGADKGADKDFDGDGVIEGTDEGTKPATLTAARDGQADDLKQIKGVGPKLELLCNDLGFYHFDQIAAWTADEVAWVDANLKGFKGRVSRDGWVEQAKVLASGGTTEFSSRVKKGDVY